MFRKVVSALPFSPALVGQLGFYARRLNREQTTRRLGLLFIILAIGIQCFALFRPPESTHAVVPMNVCPYTNTLEATDTDCSTCPYNNLWIRDKNCNPKLMLSAEATNLTTRTPATGQAARADDRIQYNLHTTSTSNNPITAPIEMSVNDLIEYGTVIDLGGGIFDQETKKVSWGAVTIESQQTDTRSFVLQLDDNLPTTPQAIDNTLAYDCKLTTMYGNAINVPIDCPTAKVVEGVIRQLPKASVGINVVFSAILLAVVVYFYARSRQLNREMRAIRKDFNIGPM